MSIELESTTEIDRPVEEMFAYVSNARNDHEWNGDTLSCDPDGAPRVGQEREFVVNIFRRRKEGTAKITEYEPNELLTIETTSGVPVTLRTQQRFESTNGGTRITERMEAEPNRAPLKLLRPIIGYGLKKQRKDDLSTLKEILEAQS